MAGGVAPQLNKSEVNTLLAQTVLAGKAKQLTLVKQTHRNVCSGNDFVHCLCCTHDTKVLHCLCNCNLCNF